MAYQYSTAVRNARLDAIETTIGTSAVLAIMSGSAPANPAAAETGTRLVTINLPSDWAAAASSGSKAKSGTWQDASADAAGTAGYFRIYDNGETTCHVQGTCGDGGSEDLVLDNAVIAAGQQVTVNSFTITEGNP